jgi:hypothetical protein
MQQLRLQVRKFPRIFINIERIGKGSHTGAVLEQRDRRGSTQFEDVTIFTIG